VVGSSGQGGVLSHDLRQACLDALQCDRAAVHAFAQRYSWAAATLQFEQALRPIKGAGSGSDAAAQQRGAMA